MHTASSRSAPYPAHQGLPIARSSCTGLCKASPVIGVTDGNPHIDRARNGTMPWGPWRAGAECCHWPHCPGSASSIPRRLSPASTIPRRRGPCSCAGTVRKASPGAATAFEFKGRLSHLCRCSAAIAAENRTGAKSDGRGGLPRQGARVGCGEPEVSAKRRLMHRSCLVLR